MAKTTKETNDARLVSHLYKQIHSRILSGAYPSGHKLRQEALAREFKVSRTPIREALSQLAVKGIVFNQPSIGATVKHQTSKDIREIYRVRAEVEGLAAELAAQWITDSQLQALRAVHGRFVRAVRTLNDVRNPAKKRTAQNKRLSDRAQREWASANADFHGIIHSASSNACLQRIIEDLHLGYTRSILTASALGMYKHRMEQNILHHENILAALERRDAKAARKAMTQHVLESGDFVTAWLDNQNRA